MRVVGTRNSSEAQERADPVHDLTVVERQIVRKDTEPNNDDR